MSADKSAVADAKTFILQNVEILRECVRREADDYPAYNGHLDVQLLFDDVGKLLQPITHGRSFAVDICIELDSGSKEWVFPRKDVADLRVHIAFELLPRETKSETDDSLRFFELERYEESRTHTPSKEAGPPAGAKASAPLVEIDGSRTEIYIHERMLWTVQHGDDGTVETVRFRLVPEEAPLPDGVSLQLVDGVEEDLAPWLLDSRRQWVFSPQRDLGYPLVSLTRVPEGSLSSLREPSWLMFSDDCSEVGGEPCVYYGSQRERCQYFSAWRKYQRLWPRECESARGGYIRDP